MSTGVALYMHVNCCGKYNTVVNFIVHGHNVGLCMVRMWDCMYYVGLWLEWGIMKDFGIRIWTVGIM